MALTPKQENFCLAYVEMGDASAAYRQSYDAQGMGAATVNSEAHKLLKNPKIAMRLEELREPVRRAHGITLESLLDELEAARQAALNTGSAAAAVSATMSKAKLLGLDKQVIDHRSSDCLMGANAPIVIKIVGPDEIDDISRLSDADMETILNAHDAANGG